ALPASVETGDPSQAPEGNRRSRRCCDQQGQSGAGEWDDREELRHARAQEGGGKDAEHQPTSGAGEGIHASASTRGRTRRVLLPFSQPTRNAASGATTHASTAPGNESPPVRSSQAVPVAIPT